VIHDGNRSTCDIDVCVSSNDSLSVTDDLLRIPLLNDVFERYPTTPINIDIKQDNDELIKQVRFCKLFNVYTLYNSRIQ
jgi:hypothetical protein